MIAPYYLTVRFSEVDILAKARLLYEDGSDVHEIVFPTEEKITLRSIPDKCRNFSLA